MAKRTVMGKNTAQNLALLSNGTYNSGKGQAFDDYLWDTMLIPAAPRQMQFFKANISSNFGNGQKGEVETSMEDTGKLPAGQSFLISGITVSLVSNLGMTSNGTITDNVEQIVNGYRRLMTQSIWELKFTNVEYSWRASGSIFLPSVFEISSGATTRRAASRVGEFNHYNWIRVSTKIAVSELVNFAVNARFDSGDTTIKAQLDDAFTYLTTYKVGLRVQLKGMITRAM